MDRYLSAFQINNIRIRNLQYAHLTRRDARPYLREEPDSDEMEIGISVRRVGQADREKRKFQIVCR